jgi:hypothetical protein
MAPVWSAMAESEACHVRFAHFEPGRVYATAALATISRSAGTSPSSRP